MVFRPLTVMACCLLFSSPLVAQSYKSDVFVGYQYTRFTRVDDLAPTSEPGINASGWSAAFSYNLKHWLGFKADFSRAYGRGIQTLARAMARLAC